ncbi:hypothetical protein [Shewanella woodyi]|uniref:hypothetical protein n=1 Tax=Shewanella woodyi TaxID=60961 RepID=UPI0018A166E5|nr:hypothetical protein [Shewanella woodyi]
MSSISSLITAVKRSVASASTTVHTVMVSVSALLVVAFEPIEEFFVRSLTLIYLFLSH